MTMFSQKTPLNLTEFLAQPASKEEIRRCIDARRKRLLYAPPATKHADSTEIVTD